MSIFFERNFGIIVRMRSDNQSTRDEREILTQEDVQSVVSSVLSSTKVKGVQVNTMPIFDNLTKLINEKLIVPIIAIENGTRKNNRELKRGRKHAVLERLEKGLKDGIEGKGGKEKIGIEESLTDLLREVMELLIPPKDIESESPAEVGKRSNMQKEMYDVMKAMGDDMGYIHMGLLTSIVRFAESREIRITSSEALEVVKKITKSLGKVLPNRELINLTRTSNWSERKDEAIEWLKNEVTSAMHKRGDVSRAAGKTAAEMANSAWKSVQKRTGIIEPSTEGPITISTAECDRIATTMVGFLNGDVASLSSRVASAAVGGAGGVEVTSATEYYIYNPEKGVEENLEGAIKNAISKASEKASMGKEEVEARMRLAIIQEIVPLGSNNKVLWEGRGAKIAKYLEDALVEEIHISRNPLKSIGSLTMTISNHALDRIVGHVSSFLTTGVPLPDISSSSRGR